MSNFPVLVLPKNVIYLCVNVVSLQFIFSHAYGFYIQKEEGCKTANLLNFVVF